MIEQRERGQRGGSHCKALGWVKWGFIEGFQAEERNDPSYLQKKKNLFGECFKNR